MKLLSIAIPSYNSEAYMRKCIESLLPGGEDVEILIVDDGSKDRTGEIADEYETLYPNIVKAIHQENGGHGAAVNTGLEHATGLYFKVVDSDDWVNESAYRKILQTLRELAGGSTALDMLISNFVYEKEGAKKNKVMRYHHALPKDTIFTWDEIKHFRKGQYILMHSVIFRTKLLKECGLKLPEHTFYVDNLFVFEPLPYVRTMYYLDVNFYRYYIGREGQSVNEQVMISRIDQQIRVNKLMLDYLIEKKAEIYRKRRMRAYMISYLEGETEKVHAQLSGDHYRHFFGIADSFRYGGKFGEEERTVGGYQAKGRPALYQAQVRYYGKFYEPSGKGRQKNICGSL